MANATPGTLDHLLSVLEDRAGKLPGVSRKKMFGCEGFFRDGAIFGLIWKTGRIGLKFPVQADFDAAMALDGSEPWKAGEMAMSKWVLVPESFHDDEEALDEWVKRAHGQAEAKAAKPAKAAKAATAPKSKAPVKAAAKPAAKKKNPAKKR